MDQPGRIYDAIDLTLSSPEPEPEPKPKPEPERNPSQPQRLQAQHHAKREPPAYNVASVKSEVGHPAAQGQANAAWQQTRLINPQHLQQIVKTSDSRALRKVLLHLCHISPALSGAVVRGLTPHSTFAQSLIARHRNQETATARTDKNGEDSAYERTKRRLATSTSNPKTSQSSIAGARHDRPLLSPRKIPRQTVPKVESEPRFGWDPHTAYSRSEIRQDYPGQIPWASPVTPPPANRHMATPLASVRSSSIKREPTHTQKCMHCRASFKPDSEDICIYHTGHKIQRNDQVVWDCCDAPLGDEGCQVGLHAAAEASRNGAELRKRPSASPHPPGMERKRARCV